MVLAIALAWATVGAIASASAGEYHVYSCRMPSGAFAGEDGWSELDARKSGVEADECAAGGGLLAALGANEAHASNLDLAAWHFTPPSYATIEHSTVWRAGGALGGTAGSTAYSFWISEQTDDVGDVNVFNQCAASICTTLGDGSQPLSSANRVTTPDGVTGRGLNLIASCVAPSSGLPCSTANTSSGFATAVRLYAADTVLSQQVGPTVANVDGRLSRDAVVSGVSDISFDAADTGAGVFEVSFEIDGTVVKAVVPYDNEGRCRNVGQTSDGSFAFLYTTPCPASVSAGIPFDTTTLSNGQHHLTVKVLDAAGNSVTALDRTIMVLNPQGTSAGGAGSPGLVSSVGGGSLRGAANGTDASDRATLTAGWARTRGTTFVGRYGHVAEIAGRLVGADRRGVGGAALDLVWTPTYPGAHSVTLPVVQTAADGTFRVRLPADSSSGSVRISYRSHVADLTPVAVRTLRLDVRAAVVLHVAPRVASVGRTILFDGQLLGGPIPAGGKQLVLEARSPGSAWIDFRVIRTDRRGRFHSTYRFRFAGPASYQFRALSKYEVAFPFISGASNVVGVKER